MGAAKTGVCWAGNTEPRTQPREPFTPREGSNCMKLGHDSEVQEREKGNWGSAVLQKFVSWGEPPL